MTLASSRPAIDDLRKLRQAFGRFATGVAVVTTRTPAGGLDGLTVNSFASVSLDPPLVLWSLRRNARAFASFSKADRFVVNILSAEQHRLCRLFARPGAKNFDGVDYEIGPCGCPVLAGNLATIACTAESTLDGGDHVILIGRVNAASYRDGDPLIFSGGVYGTHRPITEPGRRGTVRNAPATDVLGV